MVKAIMAIPDKERKEVFKNPDLNDDRIWDILNMTPREFSKILLKALEPYQDKMTCSIGSRCRKGLIIEIDMLYSKFDVIIINAGSD